jgi:uncharacterized membrane protein YfcA
MMLRLLLVGLLIDIAASEAVAAVDCSAKTDRPAKEAEFLRGAVGDGVNDALPAQASSGYYYVLLVLAFMMGLGKGGVPGSSTSSVALNSLYAPNGCLDLATSLQVPVTTIADVAVVLDKYDQARWNIIFKLLPPTAVGVAVGSQLVGNLSSAQAKLLIGTILMGILLLNASQELMSRKKSDPKKTDEKVDDSVPPYAESLWFVTLIGLIGGFATILTNSMGPMLNVFLLTLKLEPKVFVGTRATFFTVVNVMKMAQRLFTGTLSKDMLIYGSQMGLCSVAGVFVAKLIVHRMSKGLFMKLEYTLMTYAAGKLLHAGLTE